MGTLPFPKFKEDLARKFVSDMFKKFFVNDPATQLTSLLVVFKRDLQYDRGQTIALKFPISMRRTEGYGAPSPEDGGFVFDDPGRWLEEGGWNKADKPVDFHSDPRKMGWLYYVY